MNVVKDRALIEKVRAVLRRQERSLLERAAAVKEERRRAALPKSLQPKGTKQ